jgi:hypothetical protein
MMAQVLSNTAIRHKQLGRHSKNLGPCGTITNAQHHHNPVLTLNIAADNSRKNRKNRSSIPEKLHNHDS